MYDRHDFVSRSGEGSSWRAKVVVLQLRILHKVKRKVMDFPL